MHNWPQIYFFVSEMHFFLFDVLPEKRAGSERPYKAVVTTVYDKTGDGGVDIYDVAELFKSGEMS